MKQLSHYILAVCLVCLTTLPIKAQNPIICDRYTPDPAPYVHGDTLYLFVDHDEDETQNGYFTMKDWLLYSTVDMVNWTYRGTPITSETFSSWAKQDNDCWASQCIERNGEWYWYVTATVKNGGYPGIGVAVADSPAGPYHDPIKKPVVKGWWKIDPSVFIDDNGQAYLFYGNNALWYAKLTTSMTAITGGEKEVNTKDENAFGPYKGYNDDGTPKTNFEEASWIYKRGGKYYLEYAAGGVPEHMAYSTADQITGPWTYQGKIMGQADNSFTIHGGSVEYKGHYYMFYHNGKLPGGGGYKRSTCVEEFTPNADGTIPFIPFTQKGVEPLQTLNPFDKQEAETINQCQGVRCEGDYNGCHVISNNRSGYIKVRNVDFGEVGARSFTARVKSVKNETISIRLGSRTGTVIGKLNVATNGEWTDMTCDLTTPVTGVQDLFFIISGAAVEQFGFDNWQFFEESTGIRNMVQRPTDSRVYDLQGRQIKDPQHHHSIQIVNGKKVIQ
ncbi:MAG: family 43 glycosylhydrolase [Prevotella sp.]|nr:family 43 glycosylhydrolase [Prevotella sp.]